VPGPAKPHWGDTRNDLLPQRRRTLSNTNGFEGLDKYSIEQITFKAKRLCRQVGLTESDLDDIEMDLVMYLRSRLDQYDSERASRRTFVNCVLENRVREIVYERTRPTYDYRRDEYSVDEIYVNDLGEVVSKGDLIDSDEQQVTMGNLSRPRTELTELRVDVQRALDSLPEDWRKICLLMSEHSMVEVSRITGIKRHHLYAIRDRIQKAFRALGLDAYL